ncbi:MAG: phytase [Alphaproteobacteria bacterium]|nr:phytase [Alphaproteobacteria bacterium]
MRQILTPIAAGFIAVSCAGEAPLELEAAVETVRVASNDDAADDPAVWVAPNPQDSLILGTDKQAGLYAYRLDGSIAQNLPVGEVNNVDVRYNFPMPGPARDIAVASERTNIGLAVFMIDPQTGEIEAWPLIDLPDFADPYGACLYHSSTGAYYAFVTDKDPGTVVQLLLRYDGEGVITGDEVRRFATGSTTEGCVADDRTGMLYIAEENVAVWSIGAEPDAGTELSLFAEVDNVHLHADAEGVAILPEGETGGWLVVSSQSANTYAVYELETGAPAARFQIVDGLHDRVTHTDGLEISAASLGSDFPEGVFVVQDDEEDTGGQNFKIVDLRAMRTQLSDPQ